MSRETLARATVESPDGYRVDVKGLSEDKTAGVPSLANRGAVAFSVTAPDGTSMTFELPGELAAALVRPIAAGAVEHESEGDIARRYLREQGPFHPELQADLERRAALA
jgi:hypothetical protein